jgi:hypothetical protein
MNFIKSMVAGGALLALSSCGDSEVKEVVLDCSGPQPTKECLEGTWYMDASVKAVYPDVGFVGDTSYVLIFELADSTKDDPQAEELMEIRRVINGDSTSMISYGTYWIPADDPEALRFSQLITWNGGLPWEGEMQVGVQMDSTTIHLDSSPFRNKNLGEVEIFQREGTTPSAGGSAEEENSEEETPAEE